MGRNATCSRRQVEEAERSPPAPREGGCGWDEGCLALQAEMERGRRADRKWMELEIILGWSASREERAAPWLSACWVCRWDFPFPHAELRSLACVLQELLLHFLKSPIRHQLVEVTAAAAFIDRNGLNCLYIKNGLAKGFNLISLIDQKSSLNL